MEYLPEAPFKKKALKVRTCTLYLPKMSEMGRKVSCCDGCKFSYPISARHPALMKSMNFGIDQEVTHTKKEEQ